MGKGSKLLYSVIISRNCVKFRVVRGWDKDRLNRLRGEEGLDYTKLWN